MTTSPLKPWYQAQKEFIKFNDLLSVENYQKAKEDVGYSGTIGSYQRALYRYRKEDNALQQPEAKLSDEQSGKDRFLDSTSPTIKTVDDLLDYAEVDREEWIVSKSIVNMWGKNYQVKAWLERIKPETATKETFMEVLQETLKDIENIPIIPESKEKRVIFSSGNLLELAIVDHHIDQLDEQTFEEKKDEYLSAVLHMYEKSKIYNPDKIILTVGSDFFNSDSKDQKTTRGTQQHDSVGWRQSFSESCKFLVEITNYLKLKADVQIMLVPGNHDFHKSFYLGCVLEAVYREDPNVSVDNSHVDRKYFKWGKCLLGFAHKIYNKTVNPVLTMSREAKEHWGECKFIELHLGHIHKEKQSIRILDEETAIKTRHLPSLTSGSEWEELMGFHHQRESQAFIWNKENGLEAVFYYKPN